jgi:hypothetical protein
LKLCKACSNCKKGILIPVNCDILCRVKGVVSPDYVCSRHSFRIDTKQFEEKKYKCIDCEFFILKDDDLGNSDMGLCQLFSVRYFDGKNKNACSKYMMKREVSIS